MPKSYETVPPKITLTLLEVKHISPIFKNLTNGKFTLYLFGRDAPLSMSEFRLSGNRIISFDIENFHELPYSNSDGITDGVLLVSNNGGEATAINLEWVTGVSDPVEAYEEFLRMPLALQKSYIHPRLFQNILFEE